MVIPLFPKGPNLAERIAAAIDRHNAAVRSGTAVGRYKQWLAEREKENVEFVYLEKLNQASARKARRTIEVLVAAREWELADDLQRSTAVCNGAPTDANLEAHLASRKPVQAPRVIDPASFSIVYSRDFRLVGECSTGQRWANCFTEDSINFESVGAHIQHGAIIAYLVDRDDVNARYPHLRILLSPMSQTDGNGPRHGKGRIFGESRIFGSMDYTGAEITDRFRRSVLDVARYLAHGLHGRFLTLAGIPYSDADSSRCRISEWEQADLRREAERAIDRQDRSRSIRDHVGLKRRMGAVLARCGDRALRDDVDLTWQQLAEARRVVEVLAGEIDLEHVRKLVTDLRDCSFELTRDGVLHLGPPVATQAMRPVLEGFLSTHSIADGDLPADGFASLLESASSPAVAGDIACASLLAFLESSRPCPDEPFDLCESLPCHLGSLQLQRWRHLHGIAERQYYRAREERDRTADALERLPDDLGVGAIARAFQGAWLSLRAKCEVLGPRAWARLRAAVLWDGMDTALDEVQRPMSRTLDIGSILLARVMGATWR